MSEPKKDFVPYDHSHRLRPLLLVTTIVPHGQAQSIIEINYKNEAALCLTSIGRGTIPPELKTVWMPTERRDLVFSILREDRWPSYKQEINGRFSISKMSKGICWAVPVDSVAGVSMYKMLTNTRLFEQPLEIKKPKRQKKPKKKKGDKKDE